VSPPGALAYQTGRGHKGRGYGCFWGSPNLDARALRRPPPPKFAPVWVYNAAMHPLVNILLRPAAHGAVGWWDEILNMVPLVFGGGLLFYLYFGKRRHRAAQSQPPEPAAAPAKEPPVDGHD
jgi:hypothetical protein